jgi:hypothetical protein
MKRAFLKIGRAGFALPQIRLLEKAEFSNGIVEEHTLSFSYCW